MKKKSIKIDWDELESAFNNRNEELVYYLDRVTGRVVLEGEGEDDFDDDEEMIDDPSAQEASQRSDSTRLYIEPPDTDELTAWMHDFSRTDFWRPRGGGSRRVPTRSSATSLPNACWAFRATSAWTATSRSPTSLPEPRA